MNWGFKIFFSLGFFMICIVCAGIYMVSQDTDTLIDEDYYEKGLNYDEVFEKKQNVISHQAKPTIKVERDTLYIEFTKNANRGKLIFKKPSDGSLDMELPFQTKSHSYQLPLQSLKKGAWNLEIVWEQDGSAYVADHQFIF